MYNVDHPLQQHCLVRGRMVFIPWLQQWCIACVSSRTTSSSRRRAERRLHSPKKVQELWSRSFPLLRFNWWLAPWRCYTMYGRCQRLAAETSVRTALGVTLGEPRALTFGNRVLFWSLKVRVQMLRLEGFGMKIGKPRAGWVLLYTGLDGLFRKRALYGRTASFSHIDLWFTGSQAIINNVNHWASRFSQSYTGVNHQSCNKIENEMYQYWLNYSIAWQTDTFILE